MAPPLTTFLVVILSTISFPIKTTNQQQIRNSTIPLGSSLSPHDTPWLSPSGLFSFGFFPHQNDNNTFSIGISLQTTPSHTVVWTANRDDPPLSKDSSLTLTKQGQLLMINLINNQTRLIATSPIPSQPATSASILDSGNFVLRDATSRIVWESFASPTDTILGGQTLTSGKRLTSPKSPTDLSTGRFWLIMQTDGNVVSYPVNSSAGPQESYWGSGIFGYTTDLSLNTNGSFFLHGKNDTGGFSQKIIANASSGGGENDNTVIIHRATLDADGILRLYSHEFPVGENSRVVVRWEALKNRCDVKGICGFNSYCVSAGVGSPAECKCFPGFEYVDAGENYLGCYQSFAVGNCKANAESGLTRYNISASMENLDWKNYPYSVLKLRKELCSKSCLDDCNCWAVSYTSGSCKKYKLPLRYARGDGIVEAEAFFKLALGDLDRNRVRPTNPVVAVSNKDAPILVLALSLGSVAVLCFILALSSFVVYKRRAYRYKKLSDSNLGLGDNCALRSFSYEELERATEGFKEELGRGSFGAVYKGHLSDGNQTIAVKRLEKVVEEGIREFRAEMTTIGRTHHRNLVQLIGFCIEGSKKLLVYEFMSNGSLANGLFKSIPRPAWRERVRFVLDVARGVCYLHEECGVHIIHCNLKPQNILLDENWTAKISDFGLARLTMPNQAKMSEEADVAAGYYAPEWRKNALISIKSDIYSFGIVLLETVCCRRNIEAKSSSPDEIILSDWAYRCFVDREVSKLVGDDEEVDMRTLQRMVKVGLWCIQDDPARRPPMKKVILMLEGTMDIPVPPCPYPSGDSS